MDLSHIGDIKSLAMLLKQSQEREDDDGTQERYRTQPPSAAPGHTVIKTGSSDITRRKNETIVKKKNANDIWEFDELPTIDSIANVRDERPNPRYEISYKQIVGTEDVFLGMSDKSPSSSDCSHLVIKIHFPNSSLKQLDLDVTSNRIKAESKTHRLFTYLPQTVDSDNGKAKFDPKKEVLTVVLPIVKNF